MSGLTPTETAEAVQLVRRIHGELGVALCVVEHVMEVVMPLSERVIVLEYGQKLVEGAAPGDRQERAGDQGLSRRAPA
jgi:branched-chain amino acid transport system ATP-binding protein